MEIIKSGDIVLKGKHDKPIVMDYRYAENKGKMPLVLFLHGFKGFKDWGYFNMMSDYYVKNGFVFMKMNFSHNGTTPDSPTDYADLEAFGNNNFTIELDDIEVVLDFICSEKFELFNAVDYNQLSIKGHSRGGGTALLKASEDSRIKNVVTLAGINNFRNNASEETLALWKKEGVQYVFNTRTKQNMPLYYQLVEDVLNNENRLDIPNAVKALKKSFLILHGTDDETLPIAMANSLHKWNPNSKLVIIEKANHTFGGVHPYVGDQLPEHALQAIDHTIEFLKGV